MFKRNTHFATTTKHHAARKVATIAAIITCGFVSSAQAQVLFPKETTGKTRLTFAANAGAAPVPYSEGEGARLALETELNSYKVRADFTEQNRFGLSGQFLGLQLTKDIGPTRFVTAGVGGGTSRLYARWNTNAFLFQKWGENSPHVTGVGLVYSAQRDDRSEVNLVVQQIWYAHELFTLEGGFRVGRASPGQVASNNQFIAATVGNIRGRRAVFKLGQSHEAYQLLGDNKTLSQFSSKEGSVSLYQPITTDQLLSLTAERYTNEFYARNRVELGWGLSW
jgi:YaiO family outer membrane protein